MIEIIRVCFVRMYWRGCVALYGLVEDLYFCIDPQLGFCVKIPR